MAKIIDMTQIGQTRVFARFGRNDRQTTGRGSCRREVNSPGL